MTPPPEPPAMTRQWVKTGKVWSDRYHPISRKNRLQANGGVLNIGAPDWNPDKQMTTTLQTPCRDAFLLACSKRGGGFEGFSAEGGSHGH